jgi:hypothetical protein
MKRKLWWVVLAIVPFCMPNFVAATTVFETTAFLWDAETHTHPFVANQAPFVYEFHLTDFEFPVAFSALGAYIELESTSGLVAYLPSPGSTTFLADSGETYNITVAGTGGGSYGHGLYGVHVGTVPIPPTVLMFGAGLIGLPWFRKKLKK